MRISILVILMLTGSALMGQSAEERVLKLRDSVMLEQPATVEAGKRSPVNFDLMIGTGYTYSKGFGSGMNFYAAPMITIPVSYRLSMHAGIVASAYHPAGGNVNPEYPFPSPVSSLALFAAASYRMNENLTIHGSGIKHLSLTPGEYPLMAYPVDNFSLGASYKIGDSFTIGATVHIRNGGHYNMPYYPFGYGNPFAPYPW